MHLGHGLGWQIFSLRVQSFRHDRNLLEKCTLLFIRKLNLDSDLTCIRLSTPCRLRLHLHGSEEGAGDFSRGIRLCRICLDIGNYFALARAFVCTLALVKNGLTWGAC